MMQGHRAGEKNTWNGHKKTGFAPIVNESLWETEARNVGTPESNQEGPGSNQD